MIKAKKKRLAKGKYRANIPKIIILDYANKSNTKKRQTGKSNKSLATSKNKQNLMFHP